ncbi:MAG: CoB--CoM heterodisulfide reductase iron-sulfur subunit B family protein [candidate division WOR-3 bacterium]
MPDKLRYAYYPGCSLKGSGRHYESSLLSVFRSLGIELEEIPDWNCCGATAYMSIDETAAFGMVARNLALARKMGYKEIVAPCAACYLGLKKAQSYISEYPHIAEKVCSALAKSGLECGCYDVPFIIKHPIEVLVYDYGLDNLRDKVKKPLTGHRIVPYYGCQLTRPFADMDDAFYPTIMDRLLEAIGAEVISDYPLKTRCCGGSLTGTIPEVGSRLSWLLINEAKNHGANYMVTACPLCQFNLECFQGRMKLWEGKTPKFPILYFTQAIGIALGIERASLGFGQLVYKPTMI